MGRQRQKRKVDCDSLTQVEKKAEIEKEDWISRLPDEILIYVLSFLRMKEAAKTSVLSTRWRYLWTHMTNLIFDNMGEDMFSLMDILKYIDMVNRVSSSLQAPSIEQFRVNHYLFEIDKHNIDKWVEFAMERGVKNLELILHTRREWIPYVMSCRNVSLGFKHLKSLNLNEVNISGELLEHFLLHCPSLEQLSIAYSRHLKTLKVGVRGAVLNLKFLKISGCYLNELQICGAPKLSNFQYEGRAISLHIYNVPSLCHVFIGGTCDDCLTWAFCALSSYLYQLQSLMLHIILNEGNTNFPPLLKLGSLRELTMIVSGYGKESMLYLLSLLKASPFLEKLRLEFRSSQFLEKMQEEKFVDLCPHEYLKVLELVHFYGNAYEVEFVRHLSRVAIRLEKLVIEPIPPRKSIERAYPRMLVGRQLSEALISEVSQRLEFVL